MSFSSQHWWRKYSICTGGLSYLMSSLSALEVVFSEHLESHAALSKSFPLTMITVEHTDEYSIIIYVNSISDILFRFDLRCSRILHSVVRVLYPLRILKSALIDATRNVDVALYALSFIHVSSQTKSDGRSLHYTFNSRSPRFSLIFCVLS